MMNMPERIDIKPEELAALLERVKDGLEDKDYKNDQVAKDRKLSAQKRLVYHQTHSQPLMDELKDWQPLTLFLRVPNAPLDNNLCEQVLKRAILHRKNSLFYKTQRGAYVGDLFMSLIHTCSLAKVNPFDSLTTLQEYALQVRKNPQNWMPWNYKKALQKTTA